MAQYPAQLDGVFVALADQTRRAVIRRLGRGPASVGSLASEFPMALPSFMKHVRMLEGSGLIRTVKSGRVRTCTLNHERLALVDGWLAEQRGIWQERTDRLDQFVTGTTEGSAVNHDLDLALDRVIRRPARASGARGPTRPDSSSGGSRRRRCPASTGWMSAPAAGS